MEYEVGDVILCTVDRIVGTIVFVKIDGYDKEGSITFSEVSPGRIRNIRDFVVPKKKIVCKVLRIKGNGLDLSLRRVSQKETKEVMEEFKQEKSYENIFKTILGEKSKETIQKIREEERLYDFVEEAKEDSKKLEKLVGKTDSKKLLDILKTQKKKTVILKKIFNLTTTKSNGIELIKEILGSIKECEISYISAGKYSIKTEAEDMKKADNKIRKNLEEIEEFSKKNGLEFSVKEK